MVALLNLGASVMNINIVKGTTPLFPRDVSVGGHQYTDSLQKELDLSFDDAESLKLGNKVGTVSEDAKTPILQQVTEIIVLEIQKTFDFFRASAAGEHIEKIYLAGGSSRFPDWWKRCARSSRCRWRCSIRSRGLFRRRMDWSTNYWSRMRASWQLRWVWP